MASLLTPIVESTYYGVHYTRNTLQEKESQGTKNLEVV